MRTHRLARLDTLTPLLALAMACMISVASAEGVTINGLNSEPMFSTGDAASDGPPPLCMAHEYSVPGQGLHVSGSSVASTLLIDSEGVHGTNARPVAPTVPDALEDPFDDRIDSADRSVAIVVVDDFEERTAASEGPRSHGELVVHHLEALADDMLGGGDASSSDETTRWTAPNGVDLIVVPVDLAGGRSGTTGGSNSKIPTATIADVIARTLNDMLDREPAVERVVINMSWVLLPCAAIDDFDASGYETFETYVTALTTVNPSLTKADIFRAMATQWEHDPLLTMLDSSEGPYVAPVAAAGNYGLDYQLLPAAWERVIGVSATPGPPPYSNEGGVVADGGWFAYTPASNQAAYAGTSFAAPLVSLFTALDLMNENPWCTDPSDRDPKLAGTYTLEDAIGRCRPAIAP